MTPTTATPTLSSTQIARLRMRSLGLEAGGRLAKSPSPTDVVRHHLAMQAQDWGASRWVIGSRIPGAVDSDVLGAYDRGEIVRSWPMRGTVHAVAAEDLHWMLELMGQRALTGVQRRWEMLGIDEQMLERAREVATELLRTEARCTRGQLKEALEQEGLDLGGQRAYHTVWYLAQTGTLCLGPTADGEQQLVLLDEWVQRPRRLTRDEALAELGRRYFAARGPATVDDLAYWSKLTKRDCRTAIEANEDVLCVARRDDREYYGLHELLNAAPPPASTAVHALGAFDEHLLGYRDRSDVLDPAFADRMAPGRNGVFRPTIVKDGRVVSVWRKTRRARSIAVTVEPFAALSAADRKRVDAACGAYGTFAGMPLTMTVTGSSNT